MSSSQPVQATNTALSQQVLEGTSELINAQLEQTITVIARSALVQEGHPVTPETDINAVLAQLQQQTSSEQFTFLHAVLKVMPGINKGGVNDSKSLDAPSLPPMAPPQPTAQTGTEASNNHMQQVQNELSSKLAARLKLVEEAESSLKKTKPPVAPKPKSLAPKPTALTPLSASELAALPLPNFDITS